MHGQGEYTWGDGREYEGQYAGDLKNGKGCYFWKTNLTADSGKATT